MEFRLNPTPEMKKAQELAETRAKKIEEWKKLGSWLVVCEHEAKANHGGHFTVMRFTTGWKATFGTPDIWDRDRWYISALRTARSTEEACRDLLYRERLIVEHEGLAFGSDWSEI